MTEVCEAERNWRGKLNPANWLVNSRRTRRTGCCGFFGARSIQPKFQPVRPGKEDHLKRWTRFFETFPVGPNRSIEFWTEISGNYGWMDRALGVAMRPENRQNLVPKRYLLISCRNHRSISFSDTVNRVSSETFRCSKSTWALLSMEVAPEFKVERSGASMSHFLKKIVVVFLLHSFDALLTYVRRGFPP